MSETKAAPTGVVVWTFACKHTLASIGLPAPTSDPSSPEQCVSCKYLSGFGKEAATDQRQKDIKAVEILRVQIDGTKKTIHEAKTAGLKDELEDVAPHNARHSLENSLNESVKRLEALEHIVEVADEGALMNLEMKGRLIGLRKNVIKAQDLYDEEVQASIDDLAEILAECLHESKEILEDVKANID
ncbi:hypothetical protein ACMFMF_011786 [Clarireedia jacksonii]